MLDDTITPILPLNSVQSIITISSNNNVNVPNTYRSTLAQRRCTRRFFEPDTSFACYGHYPSVSILSYGIQGDASNDDTAGECVSVVASCIPPRLGRSSHSGEGKITVATIYNSPDVRDGRKRAEMQVKHSFKGREDDTISFAAVSLVSVSDDLLQSNCSANTALLLALDTMGKLYSSQLALQNVEAVRKNKLQESPLHLIPVVLNEDGKSKQRRHTKGGESSMRGSSGPLTFMNSLTARLESASQQGPNHDAPAPISSTQESIFSALSSLTPKKSRSRKRKKSPSKNAESSLTSCFPARTGGIYVVASCLNGPAFPLEAEPLVMYLSATYEQSSSNSQQWQCLASTRISGIEHLNVPLRCIVFASRSICGAAFWKSIKSVMRESNNALDVDSVSECDDDGGIVLMGFQDGSLRASVVNMHPTPGETAKHGTKESSIKLHASRTATLLEANGEPLLSLRFSSSESRCDDGQWPLLIGVGEHGVITVISTDKTRNTDNPQLFILRQSIQCGNRMISAHVTACEFCSTSSSDVTLTLLGVYDCGKTLLHRVGFRLEGRLFRDWKDEKVRLPVSAAVSVHGATMTPAIRLSRCFDGFVFAMSRRVGDIVLFKMDYDHYKSPMSHVINPLNKIMGPICSQLLSRANSSFSLLHHTKRKSRRKIASPTEERSADESLLQKLDSVMKDSDVIDSSSSPSMFVSQKSIREIREATSILSRHIGNLTRPSYPWTIKITASSTPRVVDCTILKNETASSAQIETCWDFSVHVIHSCPQSFCPTFGIPRSNELIPLCYRCARTRSDSAYTKVVHGGAVTTYGGTTSKSRQASDMCVQVPSFQPVFVFLALQMRYSHVCNAIGWHHSKPFIHPWCESEVPLPGRAATCSCEHKIGIAFAFDVGSPNLDFLMTEGIAFERKHSNAAHDRVSTRENAENTLHQWGHDRRHSLLELYRHPRAKEEYSTRHHHSKCTPIKQISCCVRSIHLLPTSRIAETLFRNTNANSQKFGFVSNESCGAFSLVFGPSNEESATAVNLPELNECCFAVGSIINLGETMSSLSSIRHMILRQLLEQKHHDDQGKNRPLELILLETYRSVLASKKTLKIANRVKRSLISLYNSVSDGEGLDETLSAALALYDIMRTIVFVFN
ncbi:hypothetical protein HJC23_007964 [Cyclotella cryptica]|uniref:CST complex subunit CTC1 n=1 Tax=Cyclotella cryptica TaxID=29204 RepID=A0ABD3P544_9STRA|eukprot:CCRYP_017323-RA/>CCRYP_017323-RA protein AED:0.01 eAED:0.01 QI:0/-1/0/1/-1/1/1/0/1136